MQIAFHAEYHRQGLVLWDPMEIRCHSQVTEPCFSLIEVLRH